MNKRSTQKGGNNSINIQDSKNIQFGLTYTESKELFSDLYEKNFPKFQAIAQEESRKNIENLSEKFTDELNTLKAFDIKILESPDFHFNLNKAISIGAKTNNPELHVFLANILVKRIEFDKNDRKRIILNESISTIEKVSVNQLKMLTFSFLFFKNIKMSDFKTWKELNEHIKEFIKPFMNYDYSFIDIQHLNYANCTANKGGFGSISLSQLYKNSFPELYPDIKKYANEQKYIDEITKKELIHQKEFFEMVDKTELSQLNPTSVGYMLISIYFEIIKGYKLPIIDGIFT